MTTNIFSLDDQPWMSTPGRNCDASDDPDAWFDENQPRVASLCAGCPAIAACLMYALDFTDPRTGQRLEGIWGGTTTAERARARRPRRCGTPEGFAAHKVAGESTCASCRGAHAAVAASTKRREAAA